MKFNQNTDEIANCRFKITKDQTVSFCFDAIIVYKILNGEIDCPELLQKNWS